MECPIEKYNCIPSLSFSLITIVADEAVIVVTDGSSADIVRVRDSSFISTTLSLMMSRFAHTTAPAVCPEVNTSWVLRAE